MSLFTVYHHDNEATSFNYECTAGTLTTALAALASSKARNRPRNSSNSNFHNNTTTAATALAATGTTTTSQPQQLLGQSTCSGTTEGSGSASYVYSKVELLPLSFAMDLMANPKSVAALQTVSGAPAGGAALTALSAGSPSVSAMGTQNTASSPSGSGSGGGAAGTSSAQQQQQLSATAIAAAATASAATVNNLVHSIPFVGLMLAPVQLSLTELQCVATNGNYVLLGCRESAPATSTLMNDAHGAGAEGADGMDLFGHGSGVDVNVGGGAGGGGVSQPVSAMIPRSAPRTRLTKQEEEAAAAAQKKSAVLAVGTMSSITPRTGGGVLNAKLLRGQPAAQQPTPLLPPPQPRLSLQTIPSPQKQQQLQQQQSHNAMHNFAGMSATGATMNESCSSAATFQTHNAPRSTNATATNLQVLLQRAAAVSSIRRPEAPLSEVAALAVASCSGGGSVSQQFSLSSSRNSVHGGVAAGGDDTSVQYGLRALRTVSLAAEAAALEAAEKERQQLLLQRQQQQQQHHQQQAPSHGHGKGSARGSGRQNASARSASVRSGGSYSSGGAGGREGSYNAEGTMVEENKNVPLSKAASTLLASPQASYLAISMQNCTASVRVQQFAGVGDDGGSGGSGSNSVGGGGGSGGNGGFSGGPCGGAAGGGSSSISGSRSHILERMESFDVIWNGPKGEHEVLSWLLNEHLRVMKLKIEAAIASASGAGIGNSAASGADRRKKGKR